MAEIGGQRQQIETIDERGGQRRCVGDTWWEIGQQLVLTGVRVDGHPDDGSGWIVHQIRSIRQVDGGQRVVDDDRGRGQLLEDRTHEASAAFAVAHQGDHHRL